MKALIGLTDRLLGLAGGMPLLAWPLMASVLLGASGHWQAHTARTALAELQAQVERTRADTEAETSRRLAAMQEVVEHANQDKARLVADRDAAAAAAQRLRRTVAAILAARPAPAAGGPPAADPGVVCADLLQRADERLRGLAELADRRGAAGAACERAYRSLTR